MSPPHARGRLERSPASASFATKKDDRCRTTTSTWDGSVRARRCWARMTPRSTGWGASPTRTSERLFSAAESWKRAEHGTRSEPAWSTRGRCLGLAGHAVAPAARERPVRRADPRLQRDRATSNPTIFAKAITGSDLYDEQLRRLVAGGGRDTQELFFSLALDDVRRAAGLLRPEYDRGGGLDGSRSSARRISPTTPTRRSRRQSICGSASTGPT
jgi:hypothetical protein